MARLYLARRRGVGGFSRLVTLKLVHPHLMEDKRIVQLFLDEARISAHVAHPNVVHVEEVGKFGDSYFIAMEYVHGVSLAELLGRLNERRLRLRPKLCVWIAAQIAEALHAAHEAKGETGSPLGIVHRDVSPQNVLIGHTGHVKLIDFGIAQGQAENDLQRGTKAVLGKLRYMSPEQLRLEPADRRTDVYALGVMLWEMLAGRNLCRCQRLDDEHDWATRENPPPPSKYSGHSTPSLDRVVLKAIAFDSADRFENAFQFRAALLKADPAAARLDAPMVASLMRSMLGDELDRKRAEWPSEVAGELERSEGKTSRTWSLEELTSDIPRPVPMPGGSKDDAAHEDLRADADGKSDSGDHAHTHDWSRDVSGVQTRDVGTSARALAKRPKAAELRARLKTGEREKPVEREQADPTVALRRRRETVVAHEDGIPMIASSYADMMIAAAACRKGAEPVFASMRADLMRALASANVAYDPRDGLHLETARGDGPLSPVMTVPKSFRETVFEPTADMSIVDMPPVEAEAALLPAVDTLQCPAVRARRKTDSFAVTVAFRATTIGAVCLAVGVCVGFIVRTPQQDTQPAATAQYTATEMAEPESSLHASTMDKAQDAPPPSAAGSAARGTPSARKAKAVESAPALSLNDPLEGLGDRGQSDRASRAESRWQAKHRASVRSTRQAGTSAWSKRHPARRTRFARAGR
jgi:serine/threonine-protein kinase